MSPTPHTSLSGSRQRSWLSRAARSFGGIREHASSLAVLLVGVGVSVGVAAFLLIRNRDREQAAFNADVAPIVANLRSAFELPLEVLASTANLFEASREVTRAEFARFVKPALERHPGIRALEWIPLVAEADRERYEEAARADGLTGFQFRERNTDGTMAPAEPRAEHLPIFFMEPGHPLVLGFDCASDRERRECAERARTLGHAVASQRLQLLDDPPSTYSIAVFQPVFDAAAERGPSGVRGFACEVFRVRSLAEHAIEQSVRRDVQVALFDPDAPPERRALFESVPGAADAEGGLVLESPLRYADRSWQIRLRAGPAYPRSSAGQPALALIAGLSSSLLLALGLSAAKVIRRLRLQIAEQQRIGQYTLLEKLGQGGAGVVYRARHALLRRPTAVKLQLEPTRDPRQLARFEREVQLTSELTHPNTISIYDYGRTPEGICYYAMEYIDGLTLEQLVESSGPLPAARVSHLLRQVCHALAEAHAVGLVHRDIKPGNLMVCRRGGIPDFVKVMDFGLVKDISTAALERREPITQSASTVIGTPLYLAPEAISRPADVDTRADLYAIGAVAYFLVVGEPVFDGETVLTVLHQHLHSAPRPPSERVRAEVPAELERIILRCLEKDPGRRFASAKALADALDGVPGGGSWTALDAQAWWETRGDAMLSARQRAS
ncbi:MAG TPA: CHASE domain-containing protein [Polyangiaceae bacterium]|nr:CHASE domain-containing protein [Polyangiaceae bacterium]